MEGAEYFIEQYRYGNDNADYQFSPLTHTKWLNRALEATIVCGCKTIAVWRIKPKTILITGEEINGQSVLIAEKN